MPTIKNRRGLDIPVHGASQTTEIQEAPTAKRVALLPQESWGIKVGLQVREGDRVKIGSPLFIDRRDEAAVFGSPAAGTVAQINRGHRRAVHSVVIEVNGNDCIPIQTLDPDSTSLETFKEALLGSGLWPCLRQRPFDRVAVSSNAPTAIVVQAHDSRPLAAKPQDLIAGRKDHFKKGLALIHKLSGGKTFLCVEQGAAWSEWTTAGVTVQAFEGPHPSGTAGYSIHKVAPAGPNHTTWYIDAQDVADIGESFSTGRIPTRRVVALVGPEAKRPRLVATTRGAESDGLVSGESDAQDTRALSGSVLEGRICEPGSNEGFLSRYANQVTLMDGSTEREFLSWALPVAGRFTNTNTMLDKFFKSKFKFNADENGSLRAIVPIGQYEAVMPMDILPTQLIKALAGHDLESAEKLGALELAEEDLALCQFVDPSKQPLTDMLRDMLTRIEKEG